MGRRLTQERTPAPNRVARPTQDYVGGGSHTTVPRKIGAGYADHAYSGSLSCGATFK